MRSIVYGILVIIYFIGQNLIASNGSSEIISLQSTARSYPVNLQFSYYEDSTASLGIEDILQVLKENKFVRAESSAPHQGHSTSIFWVKLTVHHTTDEANWFIVTQNPITKSRVYRVDEQQANNYHSEVNLGNRFPMTKISLDEETEYVFLIQVSSNYGMDLRFELVPERLIFQTDDFASTIAPLIAGCFLALIVYNLFLFVSLREKIYLYYLLFSAVLCHLSLISMGYPADIFTWLGFDWWRVIPFYRCFAPLTSILFARHFLRTDVFSPIIDKLFLIYLNSLLILMVPCYFMPSPALLSFQDQYFLIAIILLIAAGVSSLRRGFQPAKYYLIAMAIFVLGIAIYLAQTQNLLPYSYWTSHAHAGAQAGQMLLMSLALAGKIKLLQEDRVRAEATAQIKSRLLRVISHDIANPLTVLMGAAKILSRNEAIKREVDRVHRAVKIIREIMEFVLKTDRLDEGEDLELGPVSIQGVFNDLSFLFQGEANQKSIRLEFEVAENDIEVLAEKTCLTNEVLGNLISNAIKFSYPGGLVLVRAEYATAEQVLILVKDQGIGMNDLASANLFNSSHMSSQQGTHGEKGSGYGIALAHSFVKAFKGRIEVESRIVEQQHDSRGTIFRVYIPRFHQAREVKSIGL